MLLRSKQRKSLVNSNLGRLVTRNLRASDQLLDNGAPATSVLDCLLLVRLALDRLYAIRSAS